MINHCLVSVRLACLILLLLLSACASQASLSSQAANDQVVLTRAESTETLGTWDIQPAVGIYYWQKALGDYVKCTATVFDAQPNQPTTTLRYALAATRCTGREEKTNITQTADAYMVVNLCRGEAGYLYDEQKLEHCEQHDVIAIHPLSGAAGRDEVAVLELDGGFKAEASNVLTDAAPKLATHIPEATEDVMLLGVGGVTPSFRERSFGTKTRYVKHQVAFHWSADMTFGDDVIVLTDVIRYQGDIGAALLNAEGHLVGLFYGDFPKDYQYTSKTDIADHYGLVDLTAMRSDILKLTQSN